MMRLYYSTVDSGASPADDADCFHRGNLARRKKVYEPSRSRVGRQNTTAFRQHPVLAPRIILPSMGGAITPMRTLPFCVTPVTIASGDRPLGSSSRTAAATLRTSLDLSFRCVLSISTMYAAIAVNSSSLYGGCCFRNHCFEQTLYYKISKAAIWCSRMYCSRVCEASRSDHPACLPCATRTRQDRGSSH